MALFSMQNNLLRPSEVLFSTVGFLRSEGAIVIKTSNDNLLESMKSPSTIYKLSSTYKIISKTTITFGINWASIRNLVINTDFTLINYHFHQV